jgi:membrane protease YdiL (CAAX protease family)
MSAAFALWARIAVGTALALSLGLTLVPAHPSARVAWPVGAVVGMASGLVLFVVATRRRPLLPAATRSTSILLAKLGFLGLWATIEEVIWRRVALGELLPRGILPALAASTVGFALTHQRRRLLHLGTGSTFGALYLSTGVLAASIAAHWVYNVLVGGLVDRGRFRGDLPP